MASPANQEAAHSLATQRQQQQQDLIQLLAQHFQQQFYQLASANSGNSSIGINNGANNSSTNSSTPNGNVSGGGQQIRLPLTTQQQPYQQPHHSHYAGEAPFPLGQSGLEHLQSMNMSAAAAAAVAAAAASNKNQLFQNHLFRSHPILASTGSSLANQLNASAETITAGIDFTTQQHYQQQQQQHQQQQQQQQPQPQQANSNSNSPYGLALMNDMNLFSALGLNLTNNQLVLSLQQQQQSLIQQASVAARQYEMRTELEMAEQASALIRSGYSSNPSESNDNLNISNDAEDNSHNNDGKGALKFSINTILGRGSPNPETDQAIKSMSQMVSPPFECQVGRTNKSSRNHKKSFESRANNHRRGVDSSIVADCDQNESCSDSSSVNSCPTPAHHPQAPTSTSILFGHQTLSPQDHPLNHHHSATNINAGIGVSGDQLAADQLVRSQQALRHHPHQNHHSLPFLPNSNAFPWTVAARGKPRRGMMRRAVFSDSQRVGLEKRFQLQKYISKPDRKKLAEKLGLRDSQVKIWFQNRRMKWRNSKERELLSAGGSREQTLPTRNNPNPDLSDVGETIKRLTATNNIEPQVDK